MQANALDGEAAPWHLLWHLYGIPDPEFPAGLGGPAIDNVGGRRSAAQRIADIVAGDADLNRCALAVKLACSALLLLLFKPSITVT